MLLAAELVLFCLFVGFLAVFVIHFCKFIAGLLFLACLISFLWRKFDDRLFFAWALAKAKFAKARPSSFLAFYVSLFFASFLFWHFCRLYAIISHKKMSFKENER